MTDILSEFLALNFSISNIDEPFIFELSPPKISIEKPIFS
jgi:hypothetical protein